MAREQLSVQPKIDEREWVRQSEDLAYYFAKPLKMSRWQYLDTLPEYTQQPKEYQGRFDTLVLVQPPTAEVPLKKILDIVKLSHNPDVLKMEDWKGDREGFKTPNVPYATWLDDGSKRINFKPSQIREGLLEDERAGTGLDGIFLWLSDRGVVRRHFLDLPGSQVDFGYTPYIFLWFVGPTLDYDWVGDAAPRFGSVVAGRNIVKARINTCSIS